MSELHEIPVDEIAIVQEGDRVDNSIVVTTDGTLHFLAEPLSKVLAWVIIQINVRKVYQKAGIACVVLFAACVAFAQDFKFIIQSETQTNWVSVSTNYVMHSNWVVSSTWPARKSPRPIERFPPIPEVKTTNWVEALHAHVRQIGVLEQRISVATASGTNCIQTNHPEMALFPQRTVTN